MAVNFAASLSLLDKNVLLVDCDGSGRTSACLGFTSGTYDYGLDDVLTGIVGGRAAVQQTSMEGLDLIPAGESLDTIEENLKYNPDKEKVLSIILKKFREHYDYIVFDTPGDTGLLAQSAMVACDSLMIPTLISPETRHDLDRILEFATVTRKSVDDPLKLSGIVFMNGRDEDATASGFLENTLLDFKQAVYPVAIPETDRGDDPDAPMKPVCLVDVKSPVSEAFLDVSFEFLYRENRSME